MDKIKEIQNINQSIKLCKKCELNETRINPVPGHGSVNSKIIFIGEAPGSNEDKQGLPFVGRAGKLLDELLLSLIHI